MSEAEFITDEYPYWSGECDDDCDYCEIRDECEEIVNNIVKEINNNEQ